MACNRVPTGQLCMVAQGDRAWRLLHRTEHCEELEVLQPSGGVGVGHEAASHHGQHVGGDEVRGCLLVACQYGHQGPCLLSVQM